MNAAVTLPSEPPAPVRALPEQIGALARALSRAFEHDPFYVWLVPSHSARPQRLQRFFELLLSRYSVDLSDTYAAAGLSACAIWKPPGDYTMSFAQQLRAMPGFARALGWSVMPRGLKLIEHLDGLHARFAPGPHVYLYVLGVDPREQGRGLAGQLLRHRLQRCDAERHEVYLETANGKNVAFYERHGFVLRHKAEHPRFPTLWCMTRAAQPG